MRKIIVNSTPLIALSKVGIIEFLGLNLTGTVGVLLKAKKQGYIEGVMPIIQAMEEHKIYFSDELKDMVRIVANE